MGRRRGRRIFGGGGSRPLQNPARGLEYDLPATYNKTYADIVAATAAQFGALPTLGWRAGDGNVPSHWLGAVNAAVRLNNGGAITAMLSPYQDVAGVDIPSEHHLAGYRGTLAAGVLDPAAGDDFYVAMLLKYPDREVGGAQALLGNTIGAGRGFMVYVDAAGITFFMCIGAAAATVGVTGILSSWVLLQAIYDANGNIRLCLGGTEAAGAAPAGDVFPSLLPFQIFSSVFPIQNAEVAWAIYQHGAGLADLATLAFRTSLVQLTSGLCPRIGTPGTFTRASAASGIDDNGRHFIVQTWRPRAGDPEGGRLAPSRVNKCYRNINPANTTACGVSGGVLSVVNDAAQLITDGCDCWGPNVYQMVPGVADRVVICGGQTANLNPHSLQLLLRGAAGGETVTLCLRDASSGALQVVQVLTCTTAWQLFRAPNITPTDIDQQWCIYVEAGDTLLFIGHQLEEGDTCSSLIPGFAYAAGATRAAEVLTTTWTPRDAEGGYSLGVRPEGWSAAGAAATNLVMTRSGGASNMLRQLAGEGGRWRIEDGTNIAQEAAATAAAGVRQEISAGWGPRLLLDVDAAQAAAPYDGALAAAGTVVLQASGQEVAIDTLRGWRRSPK